VANANRRPPIRVPSAGAVPQRGRSHHAHRRGAGKEPRPGFGGRTRPTPAVLRRPRMDGVAPGRTPKRQPRGRNVGREDIRAIPGSHPGRKCPVTCTFVLWALLGSNQRPLPCKHREELRRPILWAAWMGQRRCGCVRLTPWWLSLIPTVPKWSGGQRGDRQGPQAARTHTPSFLHGCQSLGKPEAQRSSAWERR
jgi:hypothetical protein